uniref:NADH dehydrogenase subunit 1 n=1 Tax=Venerupis aspera TaxID=2784313 RepID=UPI001BEEFD2F|nr:NADH dehydrogenase subunit 1 [Venerupis aspera]YP_010455414.1 NADH dehydrogenase subunit 1 [Ruditapes variegatus]QUA05869.1 NADH dehydrogenase subunit 1 [Venerupis aspera]UUA63019.1 NADH dehydrogenase subunit 1 [Ruditapes variegatus]
MSMVLVSLLMLVSVAFYIVTERKGLGMFQLRQGPNKVGFKGILQPIADGVKLFTKEMIIPFYANKVMYLLGPVICFVCAYILWGLFPSSYSPLVLSLGLLLFLCVSSFSVYGVFMVGWSCDSRYAFLGAMRAIAQSVSYEVFLSTCLFCPLVMLGSYSLSDCRVNNFPMVLLSQEVLVLWIICILAETNRAPFDFVEGESELVAGYMVEFGGVGFALLALAEYSNMTFMGMLTGVLFFSTFMGSVFMGSFFIAFYVVLISYFMVWVRGVVPRFRYDLLMQLCWQVLLPLSICFFMFLSGLVLDVDLIFKM